MRHAISLLAALVCLFSSAFVWGQTCELDVNAALTESQKVYVLVDFYSPYEERGEVQIPERSPMDVCVVLDVSGSMKEVMQDVKTALKTVMKNLIPGDNMCLVVFNDHATLQCPMVRIGSPAEKIFWAKVDQMFAKGNTSLSSGTKMGGEQLKEVNPRGYTDRESHLVVISDGESPGDTVAQMRQEGEEFAKKKFKVSCIGLDYDNPLLQALADGNGGKYYHLKAPDQLATLMMTGLNGVDLADSIAMDCHFKVTIDPKCKLLRSSVTDGKLIQNRDRSTSLVYTYPSVRRKSMCTEVFCVQVPKSFPKNKQVLQVDVSYVDGDSIQAGDVPMKKGVQNPKAAGDKAAGADAKAAAGADANAAAGADANAAAGADANAVAGADAGAADANGANAVLPKPAGKVLLHEMDERDIDWDKMGHCESSKGFFLDYVVSDEDINDLLVNLVLTRLEIADYVRFTFFAKAKDYASIANLLKDKNAFFKKELKSNYCKKVLESCSEKSLELVKLCPKKKFNGTGGDAGELRDFVDKEQPLLLSEYKSYRSQWDNRNAAGQNGNADNAGNVKAGDGDADDDDGDVKAAKKSKKAKASKGKGKGKKAGKKSKKVRDADEDADAGADAAEDSAEAPEAEAKADEPAKADDSAEKTDDDNQQDTEGGFNFHL